MGSRKKQKFELLERRMVFPEGFSYNDDIVESSRVLFDTALLKPYISKFATGNNKNITMANVFKLCVILNCSPNDLFDWRGWRESVMLAFESSPDDDFKLTNEDIKGML